MAGVIASFLVPGAVDAQKPVKIPRIGVLEFATLWEILKQELRDLGYVEGKNIAFESRPRPGRSERLADLAGELIRLEVDVIVAYGTPATQAAKQATTTIPIVMVGIGDPLRTGLVKSLSHPEGNTTGNTILGPEIGAKRLQVLQEAIPKVSRVGFLWNPGNASNEVAFHDAQVGARALGITLQSVAVGTPQQLDSALAAMVRERADALVMTADPMHQRHVARVLDFVARQRLPAMYQVKENVLQGGLMSYGASLPDLVRRGARYVDKILKGAKPADLPIEQPTKFELVINLKTAKALGITIPRPVLVRADEVIE